MEDDLTITYNSPLVSARFVIAGNDFDPEECTESVGLAPTRVWLQRHEHLKYRPEIPNTNWVIGFEYKICHDLDEAVRDLLELVWPARDRIVAFLSGGGLEAALVCGVRVYGLEPRYCLSPGTMGKLASLQAEFCLDIYDFS